MTKKLKLFQKLSVLLLQEECQEESLEEEVIVLDLPLEFQKETLSRTELAIEKVTPLVIEKVTVKLMVKVIVKQKVKQTV